MADQLAAITGVIREVVGDNLAILVLFGFYARGDWVRDRYVEGTVVYSYESDFDLLIVTEGSANATVEGETRLGEIIDRRLRRLELDRPCATLIVEDIEHLNNDLRRGNYFYADIAKEGVLLFDNGRHTLAEAGPVDAAEMQKHVRDDFEHWFNSAGEFGHDFRRYRQRTVQQGGLRASPSHRTIPQRGGPDVRPLQAQDA